MIIRRLGQIIGQCNYLNRRNGIDSYWNNVTFGERHWNMKIGMVWTVIGIMLHLGRDTGI